MEGGRSDVLDVELTVEVDVGVVEVEVGELELVVLDEVEEEDVDELVEVDEEELLVEVLEDVLLDVDVLDSGRVEVGVVDEELKVSIYV